MCSACINNHLCFFACRRARESMLSCTVAALLLLLLLLPLLLGAAVPRAAVSICATKSSNIFVQRQAPLQR